LLGARALLGRYVDTAQRLRESAQELLVEEHHFELGVFAFVVHDVHVYFEVFDVADEPGVVVAVVAALEVLPVELDGPAGGVHEEALVLRAQEGAHVHAFDLLLGLLEVLLAPLFQHAQFPLYLFVDVHALLYRVLWRIRILLV